MRGLVIAVLGACSYSPHSAASDGAGPGGEAMGSGSGSADASFCFGTGYDVHVCLPAEPMGMRVISTNVAIDTMTSETCIESVPQFCVVAVAALSIDQGVRLSASGPRPLVLIATQTITIDGTIDVASHVDTMPQTLGAGADPTACTPGNPATAHGGGAGGSLDTTGGVGGPVVGGTAGPITDVTTLRGGCPGSVGANAGGRGGHGGGAVYLIAEESIIVSQTGVINASGESGHGTVGMDRGGGGGGSGGVIAFDSPALTVDANAKLFANGGGGGEGAATNTGKDGTDPTGPALGGLGGTGGTSGGDGGLGGSNTMAGRAGNIGGSAAEGGGGGGGGVGVIKVFRATKPAVGQVSPPFS